MEISQVGCAVVLYESVSGSAPRATDKEQEDAHRCGCLSVPALGLQVPAGDIEAFG